MTKFGIWYTFLPLIIIHQFFFTYGYFEKSRFCDRFKGSDFVTGHFFNHVKFLLNGPYRRTVTPTALIGVVSLVVYDRILPRGCFGGGSTEAMNNMFLHGNLLIVR